MNEAFHTGLTEKVRKRARSFGEFRADDIVDALVISSREDAKKVRNIINELRKTGEIENVKEGLYRYVPGKSGGRSNKVLMRIYRAIHLKARFSGSEIILLTEADKRYVYRVIKRLISSGDLIEAGFRKTDSGNREMVYRVKHRDEFYLKFIKDAL